MTFKELLYEYKIICEDLNKELSAIKLLIYDHFNLDITKLYLNHDKEICKDFLQCFKKRADKYLYENIPIQQIIGYTYFYNLKFYVNSNVLIPRFETEFLVDTLINYCNEFFKERNINILDLGTGSGCIAISLKKNISNAIIDAIDISNEALEVAKKNALINEAEVNFFQSNLFSNVENNIKYDIIVSNPPYISYEEKIDDIVYKNEPHLALFAPQGGLYYYEQILKTAKSYLSECSLLAFEIAFNQKEEIEHLILKYFPNKDYCFYKDFNGYHRIVIIRNFTR